MVQRQVGGVFPCKSVLSIFLNPLSLLFVGKKKLLVGAN